MTSRLLILLLLAPGCAGSSSEGASRGVGEESSVPFVKIATASEHVFGDEVELSATLEAWQIATLAPSLPARVRTVKVRIGDEVSKGDTLLELDAATFSQGLKQAEAALEMARAQLVQAEANHRRFEELQKEDAVTDSEFEQVQTGLAMARAQVAQAEAGAQVASERFADTRLRAPFDGVVTARNIEPGEMVAGGAQMGPPLQVADMSRIRVVAQIGELQAGQVATGLEVQVRVDSLPTEVFAAVVDRVSPAIDPRSRTVRLEAMLDEPDPRLRHGMAGSIRFEGTGLAALAVPRQALLDRNDGAARVLVLEGEQVRNREVRYGRSTSDLVPITSGLTAGEQVLVAGHARLEDGAVVTAVEAR